MALKVSPTTDININLTNILKIENFINDTSYSELIEYSANFNARLCIERRLRMPFIDPQTGVAQKHSNLYFKKSQRLPGLKEGQIYTYPSTRWRCKTTNPMKFSSRPFYRFRATDNCTTMVAPPIHPSLHPATSSMIPPLDGDVNDFQAMIDAESNSLGAADTDSKDSQILKDESMTKESWFYDDMDANDVGSEEQNDSDFDYNINGYKRKKKPVTARKSSRKQPKDPNANDIVKKSSGRSSSNSRSNNRSGSSKKSSSSRSSKSNKTESVTNILDHEPPSFDSVNIQGLPSSEKFGAYRSF